MELALGEGQYMATWKEAMMRVGAGLAGILQKSRNQIRGIKQGDKATQPLTIVDVIDQQKWLEPIGDTLQRPVARAFAAGGPAGQKVKNFLHGTWLGHPLHPVLTDAPLGAWTAALFLDSLELLGWKKLSAGTDAVIGVGLAGAVGSAVTGLNDWQHTEERPRRIGLAHGLLNLGATLLYASSLLLRSRGMRGPGQVFSLLGYGVSSFAAYLGGHLVYNEQIGVNKVAGQSLPPEFMAVLPEAELPDGWMRQAEVNGVRVLLARHRNRIYALSDTCSHLGCSLAEGRIEDGSVICSCHGSRYALEDGQVLDGPSTFSQPCFETRVRDGQIEVRETPP